MDWKDILKTTPNPDIALIWGAIKAMDHGDKLTGLFDDINLANDFAEHFKDKDCDVEGPTEIIDETTNNRGESRSISTKRWTVTIW